MSIYFLLHDARRFRQELCPAFAAAARQRSFQPCRELCTSLAVTARAFAQRYHLTAEPFLLDQVAQGLPFEKNFWRSLIGEILFYAAVDIPELLTAPETLCCLLAPEQYRQDRTVRSGFVPIQQAYYGSQDLFLGGGFYRPEQAGYNDLADVARLTSSLAEVRSDNWNVDDLANLREAMDTADLDEELDFANQCFVALRLLYEQAHASGFLVICDVW